MSQETIEIARRGFEQFNRQFTSIEELDLDPLASNVVFDNSNAAFEGAVYHGHDGMREFMSLAQGMWKLQQSEPQEFISVEEDRVIVPIRIINVGRENIKVIAHAAILVTVGNGEIIHMKAFQSKGDALEAVGLSE